MKSWNPRPEVAIQVPAELRQAMMGKAQEICAKAGTKFNEKDFCITGEDSGKSYRMSVTSFETFKVLRTLYRCGDFRSEIQVLTDQDQVGYTVSVLETPNTFISAKRRSDASTPTLLR